MSLRLTRFPSLHFAGFTTAILLLPLVGCHGPIVQILADAQTVIDQDRGSQRRDMSITDGVQLARDRHSDGSTSFDAVSDHPDGFASFDIASEHSVLVDVSAVIDQEGNRQRKDLNVADKTQIASEGHSDGHVIFDIGEGHSDGPISFDAMTCTNCCSQCGCNNGVCGPAPIILASGQNIPTAIATDGINVYWTDENGIGSVNQIAVSAPSGTLPTLLASTGGFWIATDGKNVYWSDGSLKQIPVGGGKIITLVSGGVGAIATDGKNVYWTNPINDDFLNYTTGTINQIAVSAPSGTLPIVLASRQNFPDGIATDGINVYWINKGTYMAGGGATPNTGTVNQIAVNAPSGTLPTILASKQNSPQAVATDGINVYWSASQAAFNSDGGMIYQGTINQVTVGGGAAILLTFINGTAITTDGKNVYWTVSGSAGTVNQIAVGVGGSIITLASNQAGPEAIATDDKNIYWTDGQGTINQVAIAP